MLRVTGSTAVRAGARRGTSFPSVSSPLPLDLLLIGKPRAVADFTVCPDLPCFTHPFLPTLPPPPAPPSTCHSKVTGQGEFQASTQGIPIHSCNGGCREGCCEGEERLWLRSFVGPGQGLEVREGLIGLRFGASARLL